jgi:hypothetical protein
MTSSICPHTIYHILRHTLRPIKGHSPHAKIEGTIKTLVFYILNGIRFNTQDFFIRQLAASGIDLFGLKFYAPWVMRLIKLHSTINYQASVCNHVIFLPEVDMSHEAIYPEPAKELVREYNAAFQSFSQPLEAVHVPNPPTAAGPLAGQLWLPHRAPTDATASTVAQRPQSVLMCSITKSFLFLFIRSRIGIMTR